MSAPAEQTREGLEALLRAGELECSLADADHPDAAAAARLTDALAARYLDGAAIDALPLLARLALPDELDLKTPEGYAYYALSPAEYARLAQRLMPATGAVAVLGVRSIGCTLSAVVRRALSRDARTVERISVRPGGSPWQRAVSWTGPERAFVTRQLRACAEFWIVDEGPGMSGSTFLAVAEALERAGVPASSIRLLCSHPLQAERLVASDAEARFGRYRWHAIEGWRAPAGTRDLSAGAWRELAYPSPHAWPAVWPQRERVKIASADGRWLDKFEGLPPYGNEPLQRAQRLAQLGYGPTAETLPDGFVRFAILPGRPARYQDLSPRVLTTLAEYCAARARAFPASPGRVAASSLAELLSCNLAKGLNHELRQCVEFEVRVPVIADARMQPHEWRITNRGKLLKTDGHAHGDDHLLPGPCDIAWDVAGTILEWRMDRAHREWFIARYERRAGDRIAARLPAYLAAYAALRLGELIFAADSCGAEDQRRAIAAADYYRRCLEREVIGAPSASSGAARESSSATSAALISKRKPHT
jgi:hypothetical protein